MNKKIFLLIIFIVPVLIFSISAVKTTLADNGVEGGGKTGAEIEGGGTTPGSGKPVRLPNPLKADSPQELIGYIINAFLGIVGSIALIMFIYGGFVWMTAAGSQEKVTQGRNILVWATIGLVIIFSSYALINFILTEVVGAK